MLLALENALGAFEQQADTLLHSRPYIRGERVDDVGEHVFLGLQQLIVKRLCFGGRPDLDDPTVGRIVVPPRQLLFDQTINQRRRR